MTELDKRKCVPCEGGLDALTKEKAQSYLKKLDREWILNEDGKSCLLYTSPSPRDRG